MLRAQVKKDQRKEQQMVPYLIQQKADCSQCHQKDKICMSRGKSWQMRTSYIYSSFVSDSNSQAKNSSSRVHIPSRMSLWNQSIYTMGTCHRPWDNVMRAHQFQNTGFFYSSTSYIYTREEKCYRLMFRLGVLVASSCSEARRVLGFLCSRRCR